MIRDLYEDEFGRMQGVFYCKLLKYDVDVVYEKEISRKYVEKNINYLNNLDEKFLQRICRCIKKYYEDYKELYPDLCEHIEQDEIKKLNDNPRSILNFVDIGMYKFDVFTENNSCIPVLNLGGDCEWAGDAGITIATKDNDILYVGPWQDFNVWKSEKEKFLFNYADNK